MPVRIDNQLKEAIAHADLSDMPDVGGTNSDHDARYLLRSLVNGTFQETFDALVTSDGATVTMSLEQSGGGDLTMQFSDGNTTLDCTPAATIELTAGSDVSPTSNYIYVLQSTKVLTKSTAGFPTDAEHIKVSYFLVPSAGFVQTNGCYIVQNWNDHLSGTDNMGHLAHMAERSRRDGAYYFSGVNSNGTDGYLTPTAGNVELISTSGVIYQMHNHSFPAVDTSAGDVVLVKNWSGTAYNDITNLYDITADSTGTAIGNNKWFNLVIWGVANKSGEYEPLIINLPAGTYNVQADAESDTSNLDDYAIPRQFSLESSTGFLIARITIQMKTGGGTWVVGSTRDLRGLTPANAGGGGGGGTSQVEFPDNTFRVYDETDNTKIMAFDVGTLITTGNTRTYKAPDLDGTLALLETDNTWTGTNIFDSDVTIGVGAVGVDYKLTFDGETNNGVITWKEDEDWFAFDDNIQFVFAGGGLYWSTGNDLYITATGVTGTMNIASPTEVQIDTANLDLNLTTAVIVAGTSITVDTPSWTFQPSASPEVTLTPNTMAFTTPGTNPTFSWATSGQLGLTADVFNVTGALNVTGAIDATATVQGSQLISDVSSGTAPLSVTSTTVVPNLNVDQVDGKDEGDFLLTDGSRALTGDWDAGAFEIRAETFESDVTTGTAPLTIASTTKVSNLNVDQVDGADVGTSGAAIPLLNGTNTWSAVNTHTTRSKYNDNVNVDLGTGASTVADAQLYHNATDVILDINGGTGKVFDHIRLNRDVVMSAEVEGTRTTFMMSHNTGGSLTTGASLFMKQGEVLTTASKSMVMPRGGSIVSVSVQYDITATEVQNTLDMYVMVNGSNVWANTISSTVANDKEARYTQARGTDFFTAGDNVTVKFIPTGFGFGSIDISKVIVLLDVYYST